MPERTIRITFAIINMDPALERVSYLREKAQNSVATRYRAAPIITMIVFECRDHFLNRISAVTSKSMAIIRSVRKMIFWYAIEVILNNVCN